MALDTLPRLLVINGPNLNLLGTRQPHIYGTNTLADIEDLVNARAAVNGFAVDFLQSNHEGVLIDRIHEGRKDNVGIIINPGDLTHTSVSLRDAIAATDLPVVEVHITNVHAREKFRHTSFISPIAVASIIGAGIAGYGFGVQVLARHQASQEKKEKPHPVSSVPTSVRPPAPTEPGGSTP